MTQRESFRTDLNFGQATFGQAMAWETVHLPDVTVVDKPGGLNNVSGYIGLVPSRRIGIVLLANRGDYPHEIARYKILPALAHLMTARSRVTESPGRAWGLPREDGDQYRATTGPPNL